MRSSMEVGRSGLVDRNVSRRASSGRAPRLRAVVALLLSGLMSGVGGTWAAGQEQPDQYPIYNELATENFGPNTDPLYYEFLGDTLAFVESGDWIHASVSSAVIGFETSLPADTYVEYGPTAEYGQRTEPQERPFFIHVLYLRGLEPGQT